MSKKLKLHLADQSSTFLPEDIIAANILPRLRIKSLFRFKCISKQYESIISDPNFARNYLKQAYSSPKSLLSSGLKASLLYPFTKFSHYRNTFSENVKSLLYTINSSTKYLNNQDQLSILVSTLPLPFNKSYRIIGSSNGLIISRFDSEFGSNKVKFSLCVANPLTKQCVELPDSRETILTGVEIGIATRRNKVANSTFLSYKVVIIHNIFTVFVPGDDPMTILDIFSSDTGSWTTLAVSCPGEVTDQITMRTGFSFKGMFYWLDRSMGSIITYDPFDSPDRFGFIPLPNGGYSNSSLIYSGEEEMLKYCETHYYEPGFDRLFVWRLVDHDKGEWCLEGKFVVPTLPYGCKRLMVAPNPWNRDLICHPFVREKEFIVINPRIGRWEFVDVFWEDSIVRDDFFNKFLSYWNGLVFVELCPWSSPFYVQAS